MVSVLRLPLNILNKQSIFPQLQLRSIITSSPLLLKEIQEVQQGKELVISGTYTKSPREPYLVKNPFSSACPLCSAGLDLKHTDVLILSQFVRLDGCMLPRRITGLCFKQQRKVRALVAMAQKAGLMPNLNPPSSNKDPKKRYEWKKYNKYFDESTIKLK